MDGILCVIPVDVKDRPKGAEEIPYEPTPNMTHIACEQCGVICWVGPNILAMKDENPQLPILCMGCLIGEIKGKEPVINIAE